MLVVLVGVLAGATGTASAQSQPDFGSIPPPHMACEAAVSEIAGTPAAGGWQGFINWLVPFRDPFMTAPRAYAVVRCAFSPTVAGRMQADAVEILGMSLSFASSTLVGSPSTGSVLFCFPETDWFPELDGNEVLLGCTPMRANGPAFTAAQWNTFKTQTNNAECFVGAQIHTSIGEIRTRSVGHSYGHYPVVPPGGGPSIYWELPRVGNPGDGPCKPVAWNTDGVVPPDWRDGDTPIWADVRGCGGLTIRSEDIRGEYFEEGDEVPMYLSSVDRNRVPEAQEVTVREVYPQPRDAPLRWSATVAWPSPGTFNFVVGEHSGEPQEWVFVLQCADGTSRTVYFDPSGTGGARRQDDLGNPNGGFSLDSCLDDAADLDIAPSSWVPGLIDRLQCLAEWAVTPRRPLAWHSARLESSMANTGLGDVVQIATAAPRTMGSLASGASAPSSISFGDRTVVLPAVPETTGNRIRLGLAILITLWAIRVAFRWWSGATNSKVQPE